MSISFFFYTSSLKRPTHTTFTPRAAVLKSYSPPRAHLKTQQKQAQWLNGVLFPPLLTHVTITLLALASSLHLVSLLTDNGLWLGLISSLCAFEWHEPNSLFACFGHWQARTPHGQNRICSKLIMSHLCSLLPFFFCLFNTLYGSWARLLHHAVWNGG